MIVRSVVRSFLSCLMYHSRTHGFTAGFTTFGIEQNPFPPSRRLGANSRIVLLEASFQVSCPADIGSAIIFALASQHVNEKQYLVLCRPFSHGYRVPVGVHAIGKMTRSLDR